MEEDDVTYTHILCFFCLKRYVLPELTIEAFIAILLSCDMASRNLTRDVLITIGKRLNPTAPIFDV